MHCLKSVWQCKRLAKRTDLAVSVSQLVAGTTGEASCGPVRSMQVFPEANVVYFELILGYTLMILRHRNYCWAKDLQSPVALFPISAPTLGVHGDYFYIYFNNLSVIFMNYLYFSVVTNVFFYQNYHQHVNSIIYYNVLR